MNNNLHHFNDSIQMLNIQKHQFSRTHNHSQKIIQKQTTLNPQQKSQGSYQKSNKNSSLSDQQNDNDDRLRNWTLQQQNDLISLHNLKGNKWVEISHMLQKSDNEVKNRYHSKLRKGIRKMNKFIAQTGRNSSKWLKCNIISKIIQTAEDIYTPSPPLPSPQAKEAYQLKNAILSISNLAEDALDQTEKHLIANTIERITEFNKNFKKKCKITTLKPIITTKYKGKEIKTLLRENELNSLKDRQRLTHTKYNQTEISIQQNNQPSFCIPQPAQYQAYIMVTQPCYTYSSFYLTCLPSTHLDSYERSAFQLTEPSFIALQEPFPSQQSMVYHGGEGEAVRNEEDVSFG